MHVAHPNGFDMRPLCVGEDSIFVRYVVDEDDAIFVDVVPEHEIDCLRSLLAVDCEEQQRILASVHHAISGCARLAREAPHRVTPTMRQNLCDDVAIWWLYEFLAGRGEEHVVLDFAERTRVRGYKIQLHQRYAEWRPPSRRLRR